MSLPVTVVTVAYGNPEAVRNWTREWSETGASCVISDNGNRIPAEIGGNVKVLPFTGNTGFGQGINRAVRECDDPVVLITNPDTLPENTESLRTMLDYHSSGSLTGGRTLDSVGRPVHSTGIWPTVNWVRSQIFKPAGTLWRKDRIDWLQGSLILIHRNDFLQLDGFGSRFPLFFEDVDLFARARKLGMNVDLCEGSRFVHEQKPGSERATSTRLSCFHWGMLEFFRNHDSPNADAVRRMIITKCILRLFAYAAINPEVVRGYYRGLQSVLRGIAPTLPRSGE